MTSQQKQTGLAGTVAIIMGMDSNREYEVVDSFDGRTFYKQRDTLRSLEEGTSLGPSVLAFGGSGPKLFGYCLEKYGRWYVAGSKKEK